MSKGYVIYLRRSTKELGRQEYSIEAQEDPCRKYAEREGLKVAKVIKELESAREAGKRPLFMEMVKELEEGKYDGVIVHKVNRLLRSFGDFVRLEKVMNDKECLFHFLDGSFPNNSHGRFMLAMMVAQSKWFVDNLSEEVQKGMGVSKKKGLYPHTSLSGFTEVWKVDHAVLQDEGKGRKVFHPQEAAIMKMGLTMFADKKIKSVKKLSLWLFENGVEGKGRDRKGTRKPISVPSLRRALRNPFYYGKIKGPDGGIMDGAHPALITEELFNRIQDVLDNRIPYERGVNHGKKIFAYRKLLKCPCGYSLSIFDKKGFVYYGCARCGGVVREEEVDTQIKQVFDSILPNVIALSKLEESVKEIRKETFQQKAEKLAEFAEKERALREQSSHLRTLVIRGTFTPEMFEEENKKVEEQLSELKLQRETFDMVDPNAFEDMFKKLELIKMALESYKVLSPVEKYNLVSLAFSELIWKEKKLASYSLRPSFHELSLWVGSSVGRAGGLVWNSDMLQRITIISSLDLPLFSLARSR